MKSTIEGLYSIIKKHEEKIIILIEEKIETNNKIKKLEKELNKIKKLEKELNKINKIRRRFK